MKPLSPILRQNPPLLAALLFCLAFPCPATQTKTNSPARAVPTPTNALPAQLEIPKSVFIIPTTPQEGKDPFFPLSTRLFSVPVVVTTNVHSTAPVIIDLKLNGISGTADHRLAIINNHTFGADEEGVVSTPSGRVSIRCLEIKPDSVRVLVNGQERILRLRPGS
jgi:hypothetical protein